MGLLTSIWPRHMTGFNGPSWLRPSAAWDFRNYGSNLLSNVLAGAAPRLSSMEVRLVSFVIAADYLSRSLDKLILGRKEMVFKTTLHCPTISQAQTPELNGGDAGAIPRAMHKGNGSRPPLGGRNYKASVTNNFKMRDRDPVSFEPDKIRKIGILGESSGLPSIYFSGSDTSYLAEKLGHAIVGEFSHSKPSAFQVERALQGMRFVGEYSWSYINAKHILIQFSHSIPSAHTYHMLVLKREEQTKRNKSNSSLVTLPDRIYLN